MSQQLVKKGANGRMVNVNPKSWIEAIKDKNTGQTLVEILQGFNMYFLPYNGNTSSTRCLIPTMLRKKGLWITYVKYDGNVYTEWYAADEIDDKSWGDSSNWRIGNNTLVGDITISANSNWVINGTETEFKAVGEKGNTPLIRVANNRLQVSYDLGDTYRDVTNNPVYTKFRWYGTTGDTQANNVGRIQASTDEGKTWTNMSNDFTNNLHIKKYIGVNESLPTSGIAEGTIYAKGPYYAEDDTLNDNPIYRLWVYAWKGNTLAWQDNGEFQSIAAGVVQETGDSETKVMSQKAVSEKLAELGSEVELANSENKGLNKDFGTLPTGWIYKKLSMNLYAGEVYKIKFTAQAALKTVNGSLATEANHTSTGLINITLNVGDTEVKTNFTPKEDYSQLYFRIYSEAEVIDAKLSIEHEYPNRHLHNRTKKIESDLSVLESKVFDGYYTTTEGDEQYYGNIKVQGVYIRRQTDASRGGILFVSITNGIITQSLVEVDKNGKYNVGTRKFDNETQAWGSWEFSLDEINNIKKRIDSLDSKAAVIDELGKDANLNKSTIYGGVIDLNLYPINKGYIGSDGVFIDYDNLGRHIFVRVHESLTYKIKASSSNCNYAFFRNVDDNSSVGLRQTIPMSTAQYIHIPSGINYLYIQTQNSSGMNIMPDELSIESPIIDIVGIVNSISASKSLDLSTYETKVGYIGSDGNWASVDGGTHIFIPVVSNEYYLIEASSTYQCNYAFFEVDSKSEVAMEPRKTIPISQSNIVKIPNGCGFLYIQTKTSGNVDMMPKGITLLGINDKVNLLYDKIDGVAEKVEELYAEIERLDGKVENLGAKVQNTYYNPSKIKYIPHRGIRNSEIPENTTYSVMFAAIYGLKYAECDVRYTSDGIGVVMHDTTINRTMYNSDTSEISGGTAIADHTYEVLSQFVYKSTNPIYRTKIQTMKEYIDACAQWNICPIIQSTMSDDDLEYCMKRLGDNWISYESNFSKVRKYSQNVLCLTSRSFSSVDAMVSFFKNIGGKVGLSRLDNVELTDEYISACKLNGWEVMASYAYQHEYISDAIRRGVTIVLSDNVGKDTNKILVSSLEGWGELTNNGSIENGKLTIQDGQYVNHKISKKGCYKIFVQFNGEGMIYLPDYDNTGTYGGKYFPMQNGVFIYTFTYLEPDEFTISIETNSSVTIERLIIFSENVN